MKDKKFMFFKDPDAATPNKDTGGFAYLSGGNKKKKKKNKSV